MEDFKSKVCTSVEQSERLLKLGLSRDTADMVYVTGGNIDEQHRYRRVKVGCYIPSADDGFLYIPAWSLHRLMEIAYKGDTLGCVALNFHERNIGAYYEQVIKVIEYLIRAKEFNEDYLEERKCEK